MSLKMPTNIESAIDPTSDSAYVRLQRRTNEVIEKADANDRLSQFFDISIAS